jgi:CDP-diacylglycerol--glycerol-3-phosphate 3-phosphatidyltransferase
MLTNRIGDAFARPMGAIVWAFSRCSPDVLTLTGLLLNGVACAFFALSGGEGYANAAVLRLGGLVTLVAAVFDMMDGRVARLRGRETKFGAFLDSTMDRYSDMVLYMGLMILYARMDKTPHMVLVWTAAFGSFMTSYARARAESLVPSCTVGFLERPEWIIAVLSNVTAVQRVVYTLLALKRGLGVPPTPSESRVEERRP